MAEWIARYWLEVGFGLITALFGFLWISGRKQVEKYKSLLEDEKLEKLDERIKAKIAPLDVKISSVQNDIKSLKETYLKDAHAVRDGYRYRIIHLADYYIDRGNITADEYSQLSELFKVYEQMGGNGQAKERYEIAIHLPFKTAHTIEQE